PGEIGRDLDEGGFGNPTMNNIGVQTGQIQVQIDLSQRFASEVDNTVTFAFNSSSLSSTARAALDRQADWIKQFPEVRFRVYGHTDLVGSEGYNQRLGKRRADAVVNYLTRHGINRSRLEAVASFGETRPVVFTQAREERNRRTVTEVSGFVSDNPMLLDGQYAAVVFREYVASASAASGG
ncbi:MAG: OmpA family protein, partial [Dinoroseobacter sp.]|nr:OmpA family protein [Dinoroseobacter sp.]